MIMQALNKKLHDNSRMVLIKYKKFLINIDIIEFDQILKKNSKDMEVKSYEIRAQISYFRNAYYYTFLRSYLFVNTVRIKSYICT